MTASGAMIPPAGVAIAQQPAAPGDGSLWNWLLSLGSQPGVVESLLAVLLLGGILFAWWRLARLVTGARSRKALSDYLLGVEQALHGDPHGARERLQAVIATDPENHYARLLLGKVLAEAGEPAQAHTQHLYLQRAFAVDSVDNDLALAQSLLAAGLPTEAAEAAERALRRQPDRAEGWDFVYRARLQARDFEGAADAGRRLLEMLRDGQNRTWLRNDLARTFAQAGGSRLQRGDADGAQQALVQAQRFDDSCTAVPLLRARLAAVEQGVDATVRGLLAESRGTGLVPAAATTPVPQPHRLPVATLSGLVDPSRWSCQRCGLALASAVAECPRCRAAAPARLLEPGLIAAIASSSRTMDAIEVNDAHVQRLVRTLLEGEGADRTAARAELHELRDRAVEELLRQAWHRGGPSQEAAIDVLRSMGPSIAPALFAASDALEGQRLLPVGSRSPAALVGRVVQGFDRSALPHVGPLFASARPEHRKILIDFFVGLADLAEFQIVLERFPPLEILHRFNRADAEVLRRFLQAVPPGHFVAEGLLVEPTFAREDVVLAAIPGAPHPGVLRDVLLRRGASKALTDALIDALAEAPLAAEAQGLLTSLGPPVLDHALGAYTDLERPAPERQRLAAVLRGVGPAAVPRVCASFGPEPSALDDELRAILVAIGDDAVGPLRDAYSQSGWLERVSIGLVSRHTNRRVQIVATLRAIATPSAADALRTLAASERDTNLRLRLEQALHSAAEPADDAKGADGTR